MGRGGRNRGRALLGLALAVFMFAPASASASTGSIEGVGVDPSLSQASVQNLSVSYSECPSTEPNCAWSATAILAPPPPQLTSCPEVWSWLLEALGHPPNMPPPPPGWHPERRIWNLSSTGNGSVQSGPLQLNLEGVNDYRICLYATHFFGTVTSKSSGVARPAYTPHLETSDLIAEQLLQVNLPTSEGTQPAVSAKPMHRHRVPDVVGLKPTAADRALARYHFKVRYTALSNLCAGLPPHGRIIIQKPRAGKLVRQGTTVRLQTSCG
jgi:hypothetical protein